MPRPQKLTRRDGTYYVRIHTPADLVAAMGGKREVWRSLRTKDYAEAKRRELPERDQAALAFEDMRRRQELTEADIGAAVWDHYSAGLAAHDTERLTNPHQPKSMPRETRQLPRQSPRARMSKAISPSSTP